MIFRKCARQSGIAERKKMINRKHDLPLIQQCKALTIPRTTIYREPKPVNQDQLNVMKLTDRIHLDEPSRGVRKFRQYLIDSGVPISRRHCNTIFRKLGIHGICIKPRTKIRHIGHKIYPCLLRYLEIVNPNKVWAMDIKYILMAKGFVYLTCVMDVYSRKYYPASYKIPCMRVSALNRRWKQLACMVRLRLPIPIGGKCTSAAFVAAIAASGSSLSIDRNRA